MSTPLLRTVSLAQSGVGSSLPRLTRCRKERQSRGSADARAHRVRRLLSRGSGLPAHIAALDLADLGEPHDAVEQMRLGPWGLAGEGSPALSNTWLVFDDEGGCWL
jgi:hypothetical protein